MSIFSMGEDCSESETSAFIETERLKEKIRQDSKKLKTYEVLLQMINEYSLPEQSLHASLARGVLNELKRRVNE